MIVRVDGPKLGTLGTWAIFRSLDLILFQRNKSEDVHDLLFVELLFHSRYSSSRVICAVYSIPLGLDY